MSRGALVVVIALVAACGGDDVVVTGDAGVDGAGDPCTAPSVSLDDFYRCRSQLQCRLLDDCQATDTRAFDCDTLEHPSFGLTPRRRVDIEASIAAGHALWDGEEAARCLGTLARRGCATFELVASDRMACSGLRGLVGQAERCDRATDCAIGNSRCTGASGLCGDQTCERPAALDQNCAGGRGCAPGDFCVPARDATAITTCRTGAVGVRCDKDGDCDEELYCRDGTANGTGAGQCEVARGAGAPCATDRECAGELACVGEVGATRGVCRDLRAAAAACDDNFACYGHRYCDLGDGGQGQCRAAPTIGGPCVLFNSDPSWCGPELVCDEEAAACVAPGPLGEVCATDPLLPLTLGSCNRGTFCDDQITDAETGHCRALQGDGEQCRTASHCASGACTQGVCVGATCAP